MNQNGVRVGIVPAAGKGSRISGDTPKPLLEVNGKPLLGYVLENMSRLGVKETCVIVSPEAKNVQEAAEKLAPKGMQVKFIVQEETNGLGNAVLLARAQVKEDFAIILGDDYTHAKDFENLKDVFFSNPDALVVEGCVYEEDSEALTRTCRVTFEENGRIKSIEEKPPSPEPGYRGIGLYLFRREFFDVLEETPVSARTGERELTDAIGIAATEGRAFTAEIRGANININTQDDLQQAGMLAKEK